MPFPEKSWLTRRMRISIMISLILSFFVIAPLVLLYTMGYRFDLITRTIKTTGVLSIDILPKKSVVTLNGTVLDGTMPFKLFNRAPGTYTVSLSADGHHTWKKDVRIESNQTTYIRGLTLFAKTTPVVMTTQLTSSTQFFLSPNSDTGIATEMIDGAKHIGILDYSPEWYKTIATTTPDTVVDVVWADNGDDFVLTIKEKKQTRLLSGSIYDTQVSKEIVVPTTTPLSTQWTNTLLQGTRLLVGTPSLSSIIENTIIVPADTTTTPIWYAESNTDMWTYATETQRISKDATHSFAATPAIEKIIFANQTATLYKTNTGHTLVGNNPNGSQRVSPLPGPRSLFLRQTNEWVVFSPWEVTLLYGDATYNTIYRTDDPIIDILALEDTGVLLFVKKNQLIGFNPGFYTSQVLLENVDIESAGVHQQTRTIYFLGTINNTRGIYSLRY